MKKPDKHRWREFDAEYADSELVIALVGAVGTNLESVVNDLSSQLRAYSYSVLSLRVSKDVIPAIVDVEDYVDGDEYARIKVYMDAGDRAREKSGDNAVLALGTVAKIFGEREPDEKKSIMPLPRRACIINSLKHPEEVQKLREVYKEGFYLIGVYSDEDSRLHQLNETLHIKDERAAHKLMQRDEDEKKLFGQRTRDTFHMADFFLHADDSKMKQLKAIQRFLKIIFGHPYQTPTFDEFAMFMAFSSALRSADLSRQVGAVVAKNEEILSTGANDCPKKGGGLYWPYFSQATGDVEDHPKGRDYKREIEPNQSEQKKMISELAREIHTLAPDIDREVLEKLLGSSRIRDLTEFGRAVHAEMEALLACARNHADCRDATLYSTTFPCHNCAKHIIAAGVERVVYVEPYPKSKAPEFHDDSIILDFKNEKNADRVCFEPFIGIGPRRFFDLFSMHLGSGRPCIRKDEEGNTLTTEEKDGKLKMQMVPWSYLERETRAANVFNQLTKEMNDAGR